MSNTVEQLLAQQRAYFQQLGSAVKNHAKCAIAKRTPSYYATRLEIASGLFDTITRLHKEIIALGGEEVSAYCTANEFEAATEDFIMLKSSVLEGIANLNPQPRAAAIPPVPPPFPQANAVNQSEFRLPTIAVPTFSGDYCSWPSYKNSFEHLVANNPGLSNLQRLHHLKNSLTGDAKRLVQHYDIIEANYQAAWDKLKLRYDNKKPLINKLLKSLIHHTSHSKETPTHLRELIDTFTDSINGLRTLDVPTNGWDPFLIHLIIEKLPAETHSLWEASQATNNELPTLVECLRFLENRFRTLEAVAEKTPRTQINPFNTTKSNNHVSRHALSHLTSTSPSCVLCKQQHPLRSCPCFLRMEIKDRLKYAQQNNTCSNCLVPGHQSRSCRNRMNCLKCNKRHHTLLHFQGNNETQAAVTTQPSSVSHLAVNDHDATLPSTSRPQRQPVQAQSLATSLQPPLFPNSISLSHLTAPTFNCVMLATACVNVINASGDKITLRAVIDPGSQVSFVTTKAIQRLQLKTCSTSSKIFGIGQTYSGTSTRCVALTFQSLVEPKFEMQSDFLTIPQITGALPQSSYADSNWSHVSNLQLADPFYNRNSPIDLLLSAEIYGRILLPDVKKGKHDEPVAQSTSIGWILMGGSASPESTTNLSLHTCVDIDSRLRTFWESEELPPGTKVPSAEDLISEQHFRNTHSRDELGRYVVRLPFKDSSNNLGASRENAITRLLQIERKFIRDPQLAKEYSAFMAEYESLGHMKKVRTNTGAYYIPHHPVFKQTSTTTKLRVVFDASRKTSNGVSLNDRLRIGPTIQDELTTLLTRWRKFPIAFTADLEKMYRQIRIDDQDLDFQRIVWRDSPDQQIQDYQLQTITYGTACAQFLAVRAVQQLAQDGADTHPLASKVMLEDFYVDDLLSGAYDVPEALELQRQLRELSSAGGLNLRKWACNHDALLQSIPSCDREIKTTLLIEFDDTVKSLGVHWNPRSDEFTYQSTLEQSSTAITKRLILSEVSKLFDPLGWVGPIIVRAKMLLQQIWCLDLNWDDKLPPDVLSKWHDIRKNLLCIHLITIPRPMSYSRDQAIELHGFCDASIHAYAAVVYSRIQQSDGRFAITILTAKTKVSPIKQVTLPRLELCGAQLLSKLIKKVSLALKIADIQSYAWCDSSIVLHWLHGHPNRLKTYVANRVSDILERGYVKQWRHIAGNENPADCATRGLDTVTLRSHPLWWTGPTWLAQNNDSWPVSALPAPDKLPDVKAESLSVYVEEDLIDALIVSHSCLTRLIRVCAWLQRFIHNSRCSKMRKISPLSGDELNLALQALLRSAQITAFPLDYANLRSDRPLHRRSTLLSLNPFLDEGRLLRVGGRLENANLSYHSKHPIILPRGHHLTKLLIRKTHLDTLHGGPELVVTMMRRKYWVISMRSVVRNVIHKCIRCFRFNAKRCSQLMGNLPKPRVEIDKAFTHTGVDCAGPINLRMSKGRGAKSYKGYIVLFICLCTKAVHIEAVSDMTTPGFLAAYRRFCSRRGFPHHIYSDNGTNFIGASRVMQKEINVSLLNVSSDLLHDITNQGANWHFIPPASPHFGGLWEAGIKSIKYHLKRIVGDTTLTFEEISTVLTQIEACLNSRPLCPTTSDPSDNSALTPGHFLTGDALLAPPDNSSKFSEINVVTRWQLVQKLRDDFWNRWQREYVIRLQQRPKWAERSVNVKRDDLVIILEDNLPPTQWILGRILETHPGSDGLVRAVTIKCKNSVVKRPITKIALLPLSHIPPTVL